MFAFRDSSVVNTADTAVEMVDMIVPQNQQKPHHDFEQPFHSIHQPQKKPARLVLLACVIVVLSSLTYALHTICSFVLKISENEHFVAEVADLLKCENNLSNSSALSNSECKPSLDSLS